MAMAMQGGVGEHSYSRNSNVQAAAFRELASAISEAIHDHPAAFANDKLIRIADIGCSSGTNTISCVDFVLKEMTGLEELKDKKTDFQVLFADLASNDFNTLFKLLADEARVSQGKPYYYSAVPGSFTGRLFPSSSIHFSMSNFALHILSKVPMNPGRICVDNTSSPHILAAYSRQAHEDLSSFLRCRAEEIVPGGILSCFFLGKVTSDEKAVPWMDCFQKAWEELVSESLVSQECFDSFNISYYRRTLDEVKKATEEYTDHFRTIRLECTRAKGPDPKVQKGYLATLSRSMKAITKTMVVEHFKGDENLSELLYSKTEKKLAAGAASFQAEAHFTVITLVLLRTPSTT